MLNGEKLLAQTDMTYSMQFWGCDSITNISDFFIE